MKKIVIPALGLTSHGGVRVLVEIANRLVELGCDVTVLIPNRPATSPFVLDARVSIKKIGPLVESKIVAAALFLMISPIYLVNRNILANHFVTVFPAWLSTCVSRSKYFYFVQDIEYRFYKNGFFNVVRLLCEWTYRRGQLIAANSYLASELKIYNEVLLTLKLGVSTKFFEIPHIAGEKEYDIIYFLRRESHKRIDRFDVLLPFLMEKGARVLCVSQNIELLSFYSTRVKTLCPKNDEDIISALDKSRILLLTSDHEGFSLPPLEAMARGLPSVIFECGGPAVYATHRYNCMIVNDGNEKTALEYIFELLSPSNNAMYSEMSKNCLISASQFKLDDAVNCFTDYLVESY